MSDLLCLSHLRWQFVFQRPQHLLTRAAAHYRVFYFEEPEIHEGPPTVRVEAHGTVMIATPLIPPGLDRTETALATRTALSELRERHQVEPDVLWFYTPMGLEYAADLDARVTVFDCMDELSGFKGADEAVRAYEAQLMRRADLVFVGGRSLYDARQGRHPRLHFFPSSVDAAHFAQARAGLPEPVDQAVIAGPRMGFFGVIDERLDLELVAAAAAARPEWQFVMVGPIAKIDAHDLPQAPNLHWLGSKPYAELPAYLGGWDVALMPFAHNDATRYISPTKTPEYLAAGRPVVSTSIPDVVGTYGASGLVEFGDTTKEFVRAIERALAGDSEARQARADALLAGQSWDSTWAAMHRAILEAASGWPARHDELPVAPERQVPVRSVARRLGR